MEQRQRIETMERALEGGTQAVEDLFRALEAYRRILPELRALEAYYESPQWMLDFSADEAGQLPPDLKRGVLSEDGIYNLLEEETQLLAQLRQLTEERHD